MNTGRLIIGGFLIVIGVSALTGIDIFRFVFPLLLIWLGWTIISRKKMPGGLESTAKVTESELNDVLIFTGTKKLVSGSSFSGGKVVAILGGGEYDLSSVKTNQKQIRLELVAVFGGISLKIPENWTVSSDAVAILGGVDNRAKTGAKPAVRVKIEGAAIFGGIDITN